ncbi:GTPase-activating protein and VPS9 domain-containing protein 1 isoform X3 [Budorcas taxicolor]|uniref:GTPase-activating protein and VPS9 domain-containing protein 1 isoform X3 n=1 Tax=Budorcas taxicolor TaxID=37181 RepID=UPI0022846433|nr:GTPase-activating protein and VPS9 domain-containing protein 1 isoform X3 [Budorcas taxicolor]
MVKLDIHTLAHHLKQERLYVNSEKQLIQRLNADVLKTAEKLYRTAWIAKQQRINLDRLIITSAEASPAECCQHAKILEDTQFVDGYKQLGFQETAYGEFLSRLRENPRLIASSLVAGEKLNQENTQSVIYTVFTSLYGNCIMQEDESYLLQVLRYLIEFELKESDNPRRLLRRGTCAFSILFKLFSEGLFSAKLFLTATLHEPIMQLLVEDEDHLEIDPNKLIERFSPAQQEKLFGEKGSDRFRQKVQEMVDSNEAKLVALVNKFIGYLKQNTYCFPHSLRWIVSQMYKTLSCVDRLEVGEVRAMCTDLLLACFICPAVVNPEQYGIISDAPINEVARFNLMQVGRLLQQLAMTGSEEGDPRTKSSLGKFDKSCVAAFLDVVIGGRAVETPPMSSVNLLEGLSRTVVYITYSQLITLVNFMKSVMSGDQLREDRMALDNLLANLPQAKPGKSSSLEMTPYNTPQLSPATTPANKKNRLPIATRSRSRTNVLMDLHMDHEGSAQETIQEVQPEEVLVISLGTGPQLTPGMMSENEVLNMQLSDGGQGDVPVDENKLHGKPDKTLRFSLCSDNLEGISEEAPDLKQEERLQELESCSGLGSTSDDTDVREVSSRPSTPGLSVVSGISATSEDIPNKIEDLRSECSSDFGGKDSVTSPDMDEVTHGAHQLTSPPSQSESLLAMFDPLSSHEGGASAVVRPKVHYARPSHPPPDPPILEGAVGGNEARLPTFGSHILTPAEMEAFKQRHSYPERLVRSRSSDVVSSVRRPMSDPSWNRRPGNEERELPPAAAIGATSLVAAPHSSSSSPSKDSSRGETEERKDSDDEKSDRNRPWWRKRFVSAMPKAPIPFRKKEKQEKDKDDLGPDRFSTLTDDPSPRLSAQAQVAEDILDKYRNAIKRTSPSEGALANYESAEVMGDGESAHDSPRDETLQNISADDLPDSASQAAHPQDSAFSYRDAKKKLRLALCSADSVAFPVLTHSTRNGLPDHTDPEDNEIVCFLKVQIAEAINLQDKNLMAQLQETMRCVCRFDNRTCRKLLASIAEDYRKRAPYIAYLTRCRQGLQTTQAHLERLLQRVLRDKEVANRYFTTVCVRLLLESKEKKIREFIQDFQKLTAADDKTAQVEDFLQFLYGAMAQDVIWQNASEEQLQDAQLAIERSVMNRIFKLAFYPNQDGDILRDQVLHEHIQRLSKVVTANHRALQIPEVYLKEAPWPSAQSEIRTISAYKTPRDKVQCILRMCSTIMNLLSLANEDSVPGADDFVPVLVFVLIKANPPCLLSTVQYISSFYASCLSGEESYWWMQFTAAVEFIKTIDDRK